MPRGRVAALLRSADQGAPFYTTGVRFRATQTFGLGVLNNGGDNLGRA